MRSGRIFFDTYSKLIFGVATKAGLTHLEAEEVVQETAISVANNIQDFQYDPAVCSFKTWLLNAVRWRITDQLRKRQITEQRCVSAGDGDESQARLENVPDPAASALEKIWNEEWEKNVAALAIERVKRQVNPKQFQVFDLYVLQQWPVLEVARTLGISMGRVYLAKHRVAALLKREIQKLQAQPI